VEKTKGPGSEAGEIKPKAAGGVGGGLPTIVDLLRVRPRQSSPPSQDIKITMNYVELKNDYGSLFNFQWSPLLNDTSTVKYDATLSDFSANFVATVSSLLPKLTNSRDHGHARILKQQQIIVKDRSDAPAVVNSEQDIYVRVVDEKGNVAFQPIKVRNETRVKAATIPGSDSIDLGIQVTLQQVVGTGNPPSVATNNMQTQITIKNGESAALGGNAFDSAVAAYNRDGAKSTGNGSPIFNLQRSKSFSREKTQYILFITPEVIRTASAATEDMTRKFRLNSGER
jgi:pilus assembly protein CpaC